RVTFEQRRQLVELLVDRVVVTDDAVEIRYVVPTTEASTHTRFCQLRSDYFDTFAHFLTGHVAKPSGGPSVDGAAAANGVLRDVGRDTMGAQGPHTLPIVLPFAGPTIV